MISKAATARVIEAATFSVKNGGSYSYMKESIASMAASKWGKYREHQNMLDVLEAAEQGEMIPITGGNFITGLAVIIMHKDNLDFPPDVSSWYRS